ERPFPCRGGHLIGKNEPGVAGKAFVLRTPAVKRVLHVNGDWTLNDGIGNGNRRRFAAAMTDLESPQVHPLTQRRILADLKGPLAIVPVIGPLGQIESVDSGIL